MLTATTLKPEETRLDQYVPGAPSMGIGWPTASDEGRSWRPLTFTRARRARPRALLRKEVEAESSPFPRRTYPTGSVTGMPSAV
jgi:hypothetical protein